MVGAPHRQDFQRQLRTEGKPIPPDRCLKRDHSYGHSESPAPRPCGLTLERGCRIITDGDCDWGIFGHAFDRRQVFPCASAISPSMRPILTASRKAWRLVELTFSIAVAAPPSRLFSSAIQIEGALNLQVVAETAYTNPIFVPDYHH